MLAILYTTYISTLGTINSRDITSEDLLLIKSLFNEEENYKASQFIPTIKSIQNLNSPNSTEKINKNLYESNLLRLEKKKSDLINNSKKIKEEEIFQTNTCIFCTETFEENGIENPKLDCNKYVHGKCFIE